MSEPAALTIQSARASFFEKGRLPVDQVGQPILRSWLRCTDLGLNQGLLPKVEPLDQDKLRSLCERHERLRRSCRPELDALNSEARETGGIVILTDAQGMILDLVGDAAFAGRAAEVALRRGVAWSEAAVGTNAIGAALAERRPVAVHGAEHFFESHQILSCAAVPIIDPRGVVVGVLDLSAHASFQRVHALGLVRLAVEHIEHRFFSMAFGESKVLRFHPDPAVVGAAREGILVFDGAERLIAANRRGLALILRDWSALDSVRFEELFDRAPQSQARPSPFNATDGSRFFGVLLPPTGPASGKSFWEGASCWPVPGGQAVPRLEEAELAAMRAALDASGGNVTEAARRLGIHRSTLYRRLLDRTRRQDLPTPAPH